MTLTYVYADQTAVLGPLATYAEPHAYDLCEFHSERLSAPRGWEVLRLAVDLAEQRPSGDDLLALADAVREAARPVRPERPAPEIARGLPGGSTTGAVVERPRETGRETARKGHLRVLTPEP